MKNIFLTLLLLLSIAECKSQVVISSCSAPDSIKQEYKQDAGIMALMRLYVLNSPETSAIGISQPTQDSIMDALMAVYNATSIPARDTVIDMLNIHALLPYDGLNLALKGTEPWATNLVNNSFPIGETFVDSLFTLYNLSIAGVYFIVPSCASYNIEISADSFLNMYALANAFDTVIDVCEAEPNLLIGGGNGIYYSTDCGEIIPQAECRLLTFIHGWGDCSSSCIHNRYWQFRVLPDCSVEYIGSWGDILDSSAFSNSPIIEKSDAIINIFPNPVNDNLTIAANGIDAESLEIRLFDAVGNTVLVDRKTLKEGEQLNYNLSHLSKGIYFLKISGSDVFQSQMIVKE